LKVVLERGLVAIVATFNEELSIFFPQPRQIGRPFIADIIYPSSSVETKTNQLPHRDRIGDSIRSHLNVPLGVYSLSLGNGLAVTS
jgi:hypothetical protein